MSLKLRIYYNAVFGAIAGLISWFVLGQFGAFESIVLRDLIAGAVVGVLIGGFLGSVDGVFDKSISRIQRGIYYGGIYGLVGGIFGLYVGEIALWIAGGGIIGRAIGWMFLGLAVGISEGMANKAPKKASYGAIGGALGGFIGGALFELLRGSFGSYVLSQALGLIILGACIGSLIGLVEDVLRDAWLKIVSGRQEGKEFTLAKNLISIGRDELADIPIFGDEKVAKRHAEIRYVNNKFVLDDHSGQKPGILVNNQGVINSQVLKNNDRIQVGNTALMFRQKERR